MHCLAGLGISRDTLGCFLACEEVNVFLLKRINHDFVFSLLYTKSAVGGFQFHQAEKA
jgi:hypothetical protein